MTDHVYFAQPTGGGSIKVGFTKDLSSRMNAMAGTQSRGIDLLASFPGCRGSEAYLHAKYADARMQGEWFAPCVDIWRDIIECADNGTVPGAVLTPQFSTWKAIDQFVADNFSSAAECCRSVGLHPQFLSTYRHTGASALLVGGRLQFYSGHDGFNFAREAAQ